MLIFLILKKIKFKTFEISNAISSMDSDQILMQLGGMGEGTPYVDEMESFFELLAIFEILAVWPEFQNCHIVFKFDTVLKQDTLTKNLLSFSLNSNW